MKDKYGTEFVTGNFVVVARRKGSSTWLDKCYVVRVDVDKGPVLRTMGDNGALRRQSYYYKGNSSAIMVVS